MLVTVLPSQKYLHSKKGYIQGTRSTVPVTRCKA